MATLLEQLADLRAENARLSGIFSSIPGGDIAAFLTEHTRRATEIERLQGVEQQWNAILGQVPNGDVSAFMAEHGRLSGEVARLTGELETLRAAGPGGEQIEQMAQERAAEIVAQTGNQPPAPAESAALTASGEPQNSESFFAEYDRLHAESPAKAAAYWQRWNRKF